MQNKFISYMRRLVLRGNSAKGLCTMLLTAVFTPLTMQAAGTQPSIKNGVYQIANASNLIWFRDAVNGVNKDSSNKTYGTDISAELTANISDLGAWTPIGNSSRKFTGTFNGNNKTISGMTISNYAKVNQGLFGYVSGATIKNFTLEGSMSSDTQITSGDNDCSGTVVAIAVNSTTIQGVVSKVDWKLTKAQKHLGGIVGQVNNGTTVKGCVYVGTLDAGPSTDCIGGIVGFASGDNFSGSITYCFCNGTLKTTSSSAYLGGILGYLNDTSNKKPVIQYNYSDAQYKNGSADLSGTYINGIIGRIRNNATNVGSNYYLTTSKITKACNDDGPDKTTINSRNSGISVSAGANGSVSKSYTYPTASTATKMTVSATANNGYHFKNWTGSSSTSSPLTVTLNSAVSLTANFTAHSYTSMTTTSDYFKAAATCASAATYYYKCSGCDAKGTNTYKSTDDKDKALGHSFTSMATTSDYRKDAATCTSAATYYYKCSRCTAKGTKTYASTDTKDKALGHSFTSMATTSDYRKDAATCTSAATYYIKCSRCTAKGTETYASADTKDKALGHSFTSMTTTSDYRKDAATCTSAATYYYKCSRCTAKGTKTYASTDDKDKALGHNIKDLKCLNCGTNISDYRVPAYKTEGDVTSGIASWSTRQAKDFAWVESSDAEVTLTPGWHLVHGEVTIKGRITCSGDVHLILASGSKLVAERGINVTSPNSLTIYSQPEGEGELTANGYGSGAAIGGNSREAGANITINGGKINAHSNDAAGIGGGQEGGASDITINGGTVTAYGGSESAGIGGNGDKDAQNITINGGTVKAECYWSSARAIGGGKYGKTSNIRVNNLIAVNSFLYTPKQITCDSEDWSGVLSGVKRLTIMPIHEHDFSAEDKIHDDNIAFEATCQSAAYYYRSCEICGISCEDKWNIFQSGDVVPHRYWDKKIGSYQGEYGKTYNTYECDYGCGELRDDIIVFPNFTFNSNLELKKDASDGHYYVEQLCLSNYINYSQLNVDFTVGKLEFLNNNKTYEDHILSLTLPASIPTSKINGSLYTYKGYEDGKFVVERYYGQYTECSKPYILVLAKHYTRIFDTPIENVKFICGKESLAVPGSDEQSSHVSSFETKKVKSTSPVTYYAVNNEGTYFEKVESGYMDILNTMIAVESNVSKSTVKLPDWTNTNKRQDEVNEVVIDTIEYSFKVKDGDVLSFDYKVSSDADQWNVYDGLTVYLCKGTVKDGIYNWGERIISNYGGECNGTKTKTFNSDGTYTLVFEYFHSDDGYLGGDDGAWITNIKIEGYASDASETPEMIYIDFVEAKVNGDINGDGSVDIVDLASLIEILNGRATDDNGMADVDGDGNVNFADIKALIEKMNAYYCYDEDI